MDYDNIPLQVNTTEHRFEMMVDNHKVFIDYKQNGRQVNLIHTEVPAVIEGKGVASALVEKTLQYLEEHHLQLVPSCAFVQSYLEKHPHWKHLVAEE